TPTPSCKPRASADTATLRVASTSSSLAAPCYGSLGWKQIERCDDRTRAVRGWCAVVAGRCALEHVEAVRGPGVSELSAVLADVQVVVQVTARDVDPVRVVVVAREPAAVRGVVGVAHLAERTDARIDQRPGDVGVRARAVFTPLDACAQATVRALQLKHRPARVVAE